MSETRENTSSQTAETPSGKGAKDENFPVGSMLLPRVLRPHVAVFYAFARAIDDVADNPELSPDEKIERLDGFDQALMGLNDDAAFEKAHFVRSSLIYTGVPIQHCRDLISAFKQDAVKLRYDDWDDLMDYCDRSAAPVGTLLARPARRVQRSLSSFRRALQCAAGHQSSSRLSGRFPRNESRLSTAGLDGTGGCRRLRPRSTFHGPRTAPRLGSMP